MDVPETGWKYLDRVRDWALVSDQKKRTTVPVVKLGNQKTLELDLTKVKLPPGDYKLSGFWDWTPVEATGLVHVRALSDFEKAHLEPASQDGLLAGSGNAPVRLTAADFEFATKVELQKRNDEFATPEAVRFLLPKGLGKGPQDHMDVQIATQNLAAGSYELLISQQDEKKHGVEFKILPNPPKIDNLPILVNQGAGTQHFVLKGERLGLITKLEAAGALLYLNPPAPNQTERSLTVELKSSPKPGTAVVVKAYLQDRVEPVVLNDALETTGPLPVIASSKLSRRKGLGVSIRADEFPAGDTLNAMLDVKNIERKGVLRLACAEGVGERASLHIGEQTQHWSLQQLSPDQLFLAFDSSALPAGCSLQAVIDNGRDGSSQPATLAHLLRIPKIDSFRVSQNPAQNGVREYQLTGQNLEMIQKLGWDESSGVDVSGLPAPLPGAGLNQSLEINLPDPPTSEAPLWIWLRGDKQARAVTTKAPILPPPFPVTAIPPSAPPPPAQAPPRKSDK